MYGLDAAWNATTLIIIYNMFDTVGKMSASYKFYNNFSASLLVFLRLIFIYFFVAMA